MPAHLSGLDIAAYLRRLRLTAVGGYSVAGLRRLHRAHVEQVAYEALDIQLGRSTSIDPYRAAARIVREQRGGYCYQLNGAFSLLLRSLGFDAVWHRAGVQNWADAAPPGPGLANHLTLTVHGLVDTDCPAGVWLVDAGLGDALYEPIPLREGSYVQEPFRFRLRASEVAPGGWRLDHEPGGSFVGMDFNMQPATVDEFRARHRYFCTSRESSYRRTCCVMRRDATGIDVLRGCVLARVGRRAGQRTLESAGEWYATLADVFGLPLDDLDARARSRLWAGVERAHDAWFAARQGSGS